MKNLRYRLHYKIIHGKVWEDDYYFKREHMDFATLREAKEYFALLSENENGWIEDLITQKQVI